MAGPTPITAPYRITFSYTTGFGPRTRHEFCDATTTGSTDPTGYDLVHVRGGLNIGFSVAADRLWTVVAPMYDSVASQFGAATLELNVNPGFVPVVTWTTLVVPTGSGNIALSQTVLSGRTASNKRTYIKYFENNQQPNQKFVAYSVAGVNMKRLIDAYFNTGAAANAHDPYYWAVFRDGLPINTWIAALTKTNDKLRRKANLA